MLENVIQSAKSLGLMGVAVVDQGRGNYIARCMDRNGELCEPRSWDAHSSTDGALKDLGRQIEAALQEKVKRQVA